MILKNNIPGLPVRLLLLICAGFLLQSANCKYSFKDIGTIPDNVKNVKVNFFENRARLINPQLSPKLTDKLRDKIVRQTRLSQTNNEDANWIVSGYISDYSLSVSGVTAQAASTSRLNISVHFTLRDNANQKDLEGDITRNFDFSANLTLQQAEIQLNEEMVRTLVDEIFNKIFSNW